MYRTMLQYGIKEPSNFLEEKEEGKRRIQKAKGKIPDIIIMLETQVIQVSSRFWKIKHGLRRGLSKEEREHIEKQIIKYFPEDNLIDEYFREIYLSILNFE